MTDTRALPKFKGGNMRLRTLRILSIGLILTTVAACSSVKLADTHKDSAAKQFSVSEGASNIYIYRDQNVVINTDVAVDIDGQPAGEVKHKTFILKSVAPGKHVITTHAENKDQLEIVTEAGKNHYFRLDVHLGLITNIANLHPVSEKEGKAAVLESQLAE